MDTAWLPYNRQMSRRAYRVALWCVAIGYLAFVLAVGFWPSPVDEPVQPQITRALDTLHTQGLPKTVDYGAVEFTANIWFFIPSARSSPRSCRYGCGGWPHWAASRCRAPLSWGSSRSGRSGWQAGTT